MNNNDQKKEIVNDKNSKMKTTLKVLGATTLSVAAGVLVYKFVKGKNLKEIFNKATKKVVEKGESLNKNKISQRSSVNAVESASRTVETQGVNVTERASRTVETQRIKISQKTKNISSMQTENALDSVLDVDLSRIRNGINGKIRTEAELSNKDIVKLIDSQILNTKPEEIKNLISSFPQEDQIVVKKLLKELTQFGNMESMDDIAKALESTVEKSQTIFNQEKNTLSDVMSYLCKSKMSFGSKNGFMTSFTIDLPHSTVLLDDVLLKELESNNVLLNELKNNMSNIKIITPEAWITGINPFNQTKDMKKIVEECLKRVKDVKASNPSMSEASAIKTAIRQPLYDRLSKLGIDTKKINFIENSKSIVDVDSKYFSELIVRQLNHPSMNEQQLEKILNKFHKDYHPYIREMLAHNADINSPKSLSLQLKNMHEKILQMNGGTDKGIYYVIPNSRKSYSLIAMQYQLTNDIPSSKILSLSDAISNVIPKDAKKLIVLDDVAASGDSLVTQIKKLSCCKYNGQIKEVIAVPVMTTKQAVKNFNENFVHNMLVKTVNGYADSDWYKSLSDIDKAMIEKIMYGRGYGKTGCCITFPYMAPDNNNTFFASEFAHNFTLNGEGVKNGSYSSSIERILSVA